MSKLAPSVVVKLVTESVRVVLVTKPNGARVTSHRSILEAACPHCRARIGWPCVGARGPMGGTHFRSAREALRLRTIARERARSETCAT